jgi:translation initiation factor 2-alpha kinase 4
MHKYFHTSDFGIRINYTQTLDQILNDCNVLPTLRVEALDILSSLRKPSTLSQIKLSLQKLGLTKQSIDKLVSMDISIAVNSSSDLTQLTKTLGSDIAKQSISLASNLELLGVKNHITFDPLLVYNPPIFQGLVFQIYRKSTGVKYDVIAAGGRYESLLRKMRGPFSQRSNLKAVGVNIAISKFISNVAVAQGHMLEESKSASATMNPCRKADVLLVAFGSNAAVQSAKLELASQMWSMGVSCDFSFHPSMTNYEALDQYKNLYQNAVILKPKGHDSYTLKVRNFVTKSESEVSKSSLLFLIQGAHPSRSHISLFGNLEADHSAIENENTHHEIIAIPNPGKKKKGMGINQLHFDKATAAVQSLFVHSAVFIVEITHVDLLKLSKSWFADPSLLKKLQLDCHPQYVLDVQKKILKALSTDSSVICWVYSMLDSKAVPVLKP